MSLHSPHVPMATDLYIAIVCWFIAMCLEGIDLPPFVVWAVVMCLALCFGFLGVLGPIFT